MPSKLLVNEFWAFLYLCGFVLFVGGSFIYLLFFSVLRLECVLEMNEWQVLYNFNSCKTVFYELSWHAIRYLPFHHWLIWPHI